MLFPLQLETLIGKPLMFLVFGLIGFAFGFVLESAGFGNSKKLAAQFYFKDMTVLKVMFGAIVTAMVLLFITVGLGILDFNLVWVNPTYLASGILGGLIMGVGFIIGGFCPGTSLVAMANGLPPSAKTRPASSRPQPLPATIRSVSASPPRLATASKHPIPARTSGNWRTPPRSSCRSNATRAVVGVGS